MGKKCFTQLTWINSENTTFKEGKKKREREREKKILLG